jgi:hypothetical protein
MDGDSEIVCEALQNNLIGPKTTWLTSKKYTRMKLKKKLIEKKYSNPTSCLSQV